MSKFPSLFLKYDLNAPCFQEHNCSTTIMKSQDVSFPQGREVEDSSHSLRISHLPGVGCCVGCKSFMWLIRHHNNSGRRILLLLSFRSWTSGISESLSSLYKVLQLASNWPRIQILVILIPDSVLFLRPCSTLCGTVSNYIILKESNLFALT